MNIKLPQKVRIAVLAAAAFILVLSCFYIYRGWKYPGFIEEKLIHYAYKHKAQITYQVNLAPNMLYEGTTLDGGGPFVSKYVRDIKTLLTYQFEGDCTAAIQGEYEIIGLMQGLVKEGEKSKVIWEKKYPLSDKTPFSIQEKNLVLEKEVTLNFREYNTFVKDFLDETKLNTDVQMTVFWNINTQSQTAKGTVTEKLSPALAFALGEGYFEIEGEPLKEKNGTLQESVKRPALPNKKEIAIFSLLGGLALLSLIFTSFFTRGYSPVADPYLKHKKRILKEHTDRLVILRGKAPYTRSICIELATIEDLVRVADELRKPILYSEEEKSPRTTTFYLNTEQEVYLYQLKDEQENIVNINSPNPSPTLEA